MADCSTTRNFLPPLIYFGSGDLSDFGESFRYQIIGYEGLGTHSNAGLIVIAGFEVHGIQKGHFKARDRVVTIVCGRKLRGEI